MDIYFGNIYFPLCNVKAQTRTVSKAQVTKTKGKVKKVKAAPPPTYVIKIDTASINLATAPIDSVGGYQYSLVNLKLTVTGIAPKTNVFATFIIDDYTTSAKPQFNKIPIPSDTFTIPINKSLFHGVGSPYTVEETFTLIFKKVTNEKGIAYIKINGQPEFVKINFAKPSPAKTLNTITLLDSTTTVQLDTFKKNVANHFPVKLYLKLSKGAGMDATFKVNIESLARAKNMKLSEDDKDVYTIKIAATDWNSKKDTTVSKNINLYTQELEPILKEEDANIRLESGGGTHIVKLMPSKTVTKTNVLKLVEIGKAKIMAYPRRITISHYANAGVDSTSLVYIKVKLSSPWDGNHNQLLFAINDTSSYVTKHFQLSDNLKTITKDVWEAALERNGILEVALHIKTINLVDSLSDIRFLEIVLVGQETADPGIQKIVVVVKDSPFWAEVGTNFDLLDNIKTNNFYAGVYGYLKDVAGTGEGKKNLSFTGGVYESQSVSLGSSSSMPFNYIDGSSTVASPNFPKTPYQFFTDTGRIKTTTSIKNIGLFFSPQIRLTEAPTEEKGIHLYLSLYMEMLWQRVTSTLDYSQTAKTNTTYTANLDSLQKVPFRESQFDFDYRSHYIGLGLPIFIKDHDFSMYINGVYGLTTQRFVLVDNSDTLNIKQYNSKVQSINPAYTNNVDGMSLINFAQPRSRWNSFYLVQYRLTEIKYGLTFSGEVRGLFLYGSKPVITLALSKKFDLSALLKPLVAPF